MNDRYRYFNTQGRFWTPEWDVLHDEPRRIEAVRLADGGWHEFARFVCEREANAVYQESVRRGLGLPA